MQQIDKSIRQQPVEDTSRPTRGPVVIDPSQFKLIAGGAPRALQAAPVVVCAPKRGW